MLENAELLVASEVNRPGCGEVMKGCSPNRRLSVIVVSLRTGLQVPSWGALRERKQRSLQKHRLKPKRFASDLNYSGDFLILNFSLLTGS